MRLISILLLLVLAACGSGRIDYPTFLPTDPATISIVDRIHSGMTPMQSVSGYSCHKGLVTRTPASMQEATQMAAAEAAKIGADGIANIRRKQIGSVWRCQAGGIMVTAEAFKRSPAF